VKRSPLALLLFTAAGPCRAAQELVTVPTRSAAAARAVKDWMFGREFSREIN
jgi:hypothetical protein